MARAPVNKLLQREVRWLGNNFCRHGHTYLEHYSCFLKEAPETSPIIEKVGFLDIEASNLHADFGYMFSYAIKQREGDILGRVLTTQEIQNFTFDRKLVRELCKDLKKFHRVVVHWGVDRRYDLPFCRTRALKYGLDFPLYREVLAEDTYSMAKAKLRLSRNRLENICNFFEIPCKQHKLDPGKWQKALAGDEKSLQWIWEHNREDVVSLEGVWEKLNQHVHRSRTSI